MATAPPGLGMIALSARAVDVAKTIETPRFYFDLLKELKQKSKAQIEAALTGDYRPELLFVVSQTLHDYRQMQQQIAQFLGHFVIIPCLDGVDQSSAIDAPWVTKR